MNWKEIFAIFESRTDGKVYRAGGSVEFDDLPELGEDHLGYVYNVTDAFTTTADFVEGAGVSYPAGTNVIIVDVGTESTPVYKYDVLSGLYEVDDQMSDVSENPVQNKVVKAAIEEAAEGEEITTTVTGSDLTLSTAAGNPLALTIYGKSEVVDGAIVSAGEGYAAVDLGTLNWTAHPTETGVYISYYNITMRNDQNVISNIYPAQFYTSWSSFTANKAIGLIIDNDRTVIRVRDTDYTTLADFTSHISGTILAYPLADPSQGNCIAVKTDDGTGIDGTMTVFETGTPLYGVSDSIRDVMQWGGSAGTVTKKCVKVRLADLMWHESSPQHGGFSVNILNMPSGSYNLISTYSFNNQINFSWNSFGDYPDNTMFRNRANKYLYIKSTSYANNLTGFVASLGDAELVYELATPTITPLSAADVAQFRQLRTYDPNTAVSNNAGSVMDIRCYKNTDNGKAVADIQAELDGKITISPALTLTVNGWSNNAQTVTFAHDTSKRNVIDVDSASVEEWASCGVMAISETATGITFKCSTVPENALTFRVTSMGVN